MLKTLITIFDINSSSLKHEIKKKNPKNILRLWSKRNRQKELPKWNCKLDNTKIKTIIATVKQRCIYSTLITFNQNIYKFYKNKTPTFIALYDSSFLLNVRQGVKMFFRFYVRSANGLKYFCKYIYFEERNKKSKFMKVVHGTMKIGPLSH